MKNKSQRQSKRSLVLGTAGALSLALLIPLGASAALGGGIAMKATHTETGYSKIYGLSAPKESSNPEPTTPVPTNPPSSPSPTPTDTAPAPIPVADRYYFMFTGFTANKSITITVYNGENRQIYSGNSKVDSSGTAADSILTTMNSYKDQLPLRITVKYSDSQQLYTANFKRGDETYGAGNRNMILEGYRSGANILPKVA